MSKMYTRVFLLGVMMLSCSFLTQPPTAPPALIPETGGTPPEFPSPLPSATPSRLPPNTPTSTPTQKPETGLTFVPVDITNACTLFSISELAELFSNPPEPTSQSATVDGDTSSACTYESNDVYIQVMLMPFPYDNEFNDLIEQIRDTPDFTQFSVAEANIYQTLWPTDQNTTHQALAAVILKGDLAIQIVGMSRYYQYDRMRESLLLGKIAKRLPLIRSDRAPCSLLTVDELWTIIPDPPAPLHELDSVYGYEVSVCKYINDEFNLELSLSSETGFADMLKSDAEEFMEASMLLSHFTSPLGADIYYYGESREDGYPSDGFSGTVIKNNIGIRIIGMGSAYQYNADREATLLNTIAGRLP